LSAVRGLQQQSGRWDSVVHGEQQKEKAGGGKGMKDSQKIITNTINNFRVFLLEKNRMYGDSALKPLGIFTKHLNEDNSRAENSILTRLDDKLNRVKNSTELRKNDVSDLIGYLFLLCVDQGWESFEDLLD